MKKIFFSIGLLVTLLGQWSLSLAQVSGVSDSDRRSIERELERRISQDTGENVRVRINTAESYGLNNRDTAIRGTAYLEGGRNNRREIRFDVAIDQRRNRINSVNWSYTRDQNYNNYPNNNYPNNSSGQFRGRYEIQLVATNRWLIAGRNGQVVQSNSGSPRSRQWTFEDAGNGYYYIRSVETGELLTIEGNGDNGSSIVLSNQSRYRDAQLWEIRTGPDNGYYFIARNGKSIDSPSSARYDGGRMQVYNRNGEANQRFLLHQVGDNFGRNDDYNRGRDRYDNRNNYGAGRLTWSGQVDDVVELEIQGNRVYARTISGRPVSYPNSNFSNSLPRQNVNVSARLIRGRGNVEVIEQPSARNNYRAIVRIRDSQGGADNYEIEVTWN